MSLRDTQNRGACRQLATVSFPPDALDGPLPLIISHRHSFIFFAVPRTGTHALRRALGQHLGSDAWEQQDLYEKKRLPIEPLAKLRHGHISVAQLMAHLPQDVWHSYFKFAIVRNPFDRFVSTCFFLARKQPKLIRNPTQFMKQAIVDPGFRRRILVLPQSDLLCDETGVVQLDYVGRFENFQESCDHIFEIIRIPRTQLEKRNASNHEHWSSYYDERLIDDVGKLYARDFENFQYSFSGPGKT
jgi:hypothetical protein